MEAGAGAGAKAKEKCDWKEKTITLNLKINLLDKRWHHDTINLFEDIDGIVSEGCKKCNSMYNEKNQDLEKIHEHQENEHSDEEIIRATKELIYQALEEYVSPRDYKVTIEDISISSPDGSNKISMTMEDGIRSLRGVEDQEFEFGKSFELEC